MGFLYFIVTLKKNLFLKNEKKRNFFF